MSEKLVLIDGHSILNRAFYGIPELTNSAGLHTNAVYGFLNIMLKILDEEKPDYLTVAFDIKHPTFRHEMYEAYKGTRKGMPEELKEQVPLIQDVLRAMGIKIVMKKGYEADDILGTIAKMAEKQGMQVSLVSGDRDLLQLATDQIMIRIPKTKRGGTEIEDYHTQDVIDKYGITPIQVIDLKGLMGDSADNIPGVAGIGEKTAVKILQEYPTVEAAYENLEQITSKRTKNLLEAGRDSAFLSKTLATIKTDCDLDYALEDAKMPELFNEESFGWMKKLEFKSLLKRFGRDQVKKAVQIPEIKEIKTLSEWKVFQTEMKKNQPEYIGVSVLGDLWSNEGAKKKKKSPTSVGQMTLIFEDGMLSVREEKLSESGDYPFFGLAVSYLLGEKVITACVLCDTVLTKEQMIANMADMIQKAKHVALNGWKNIMHLVTPIQELDEKNIPKNQMLFQDETVEQQKKLFDKIIDTEIAAYLLNPLKDSYQTEDIARDYLDLTVPSYAEVFGKKTIEEMLEEKSIEKQKDISIYLANDAYVSCLAYPVLKEALEEQGMWKLYQEIEMPTAYYLFQMERIGVRANRKTLKNMSEMLEKRVKELEKEIHTLAGEEFNINSPKQLGVILFEKLNLPFAKKTKTGYSTSADILEKLRTKDPIIPMILEYRQVSKLKSTYADGLQIYIDKDQRIHGKFNQTITATGRISSTEPNLQNIPIRMELGRQLRKVFLPKEGCVFLDADYSQIELRVLAHLSGDGELIEAYRENQDIHRSTASKVFHIPFDEVTDLQRRNAKAVNFGIVYGISSFGLGQDLNISRKEAQEYIEQYFKTYPAIKSYLDGLVKTAKDTGKSHTMFGRIRPIPELASKNFMQKSFGERIAMNSPIQGTAADILKIAMIKVSQKLLENHLQARVVLQIHDELLVETPLDEVEAVKKILQQEMEKAADLAVPLEVEVEQGENWYEAH